MLTEPRRHGHTRPTAPATPAPDPQEAYRSLQRRLFAEAVEDAAIALGETHQRTGYGLRAPDALLSVAIAFFQVRCPRPEDAGNPHL